MFRGHLNNGIGGPLVVIQGINPDYPIGCPNKSDEGTKEFYPIWTVQKKVNFYFDTPSILGSTAPGLSGKEFIGCMSF